MSSPLLYVLVLAYAAVGLCLVFRSLLATKVGAAVEGEAALSIHLPLPYLENRSPGMSLMVQLQSCTGNLGHALRGEPLEVGKSVDCLLVMNVPTICAADLIVLEDWSMENGQQPSGYASLYTGMDKKRGDHYILAELRVECVNYSGITIHGSQMRNDVEIEDVQLYISCRWTAPEHYIPSKEIQPNRHEPAFA